MSFLTNQLTQDNQIYIIILAIVLKFKKELELPFEGGIKLA